MSNFVIVSDNASFDSAIGSAEMTAIRRAVPAFEDAFQRELEDEGPEMGSFEAMSLFARWVDGLIKNDPGHPDVLQAFGVIEEIASTDIYPLGRPLVTEFVEALWGNEGATRLMGPNTMWTE